MQVRQQRDIAIVGLSCRFPGAADSRAFWQNLRDGVESVRFFSEQELIDAGWPADVVRRPHYVPARGYLADIDRFDAGFFGCTAREAEVIDPQQRVFLECAWEALEDAGCNPETFDGAIGVYAGCSLSTYLAQLFHDADARRSVDPFVMVLGSAQDYLATRLAYKCNLRGPAVTVQTACSTSLVAVHLACQALLTGECDAALAGGVSIGVPAVGGYMYQPGGISAIDGHCRAFDADATGTLIGQGAGIVLLKRLSDAIAHRDHIRAIIKGSAINNDGALKVGFTAPSVTSQTEVILVAMGAAGVLPETIGYVEAHGTATALGDPIEVAALTQAFGTRTTRRQYCALGSVKTNFGHLDAAAGIAGLIKTVLALEAQCLPPSLHFRRPNPQIAFADSPFYVNTSAAPWPGQPGQPRRAGVSSFGIGGTNAHVVLEEAPPLAVAAAAADPARAAAIPPAQLLVISARDAAAVQAACTRLADHLAVQPTVSLADVAYTLQVGRKAFPWRVGVVGRTAADVVAPLGAARGVALPERVPPVVFLCPGQGAQYAGLGRRLYEVNRVFRASLDASVATLGTRLGADLRTLLFADDPAALAPTAVTQPALFAVTYALAQVWQAWGVVPQALLGHSVGEYVAACLAGVFDAETALHLVVERGRLMGETPAGAMLAVRAAVETLTPQLAPPLEVAAVNGPLQTVLAGPLDAIAAFDAQWRAAGGACTRLATQHAFHSALMDDAVARFGDVLARATFAPPQMPFVSNVSGTWIRDEEAIDPAYWARQLRAPVQFMRGVTTICASEPPPLLLEVGPGRRLTRAALDIVRDRAVHAYASLPLDDPEREDDTLLEAAGAVWRCGLELRWPRVHDDEPRVRVALPTYPFQRQRYWLPGTLTVPGVSPLPTATSEPARTGTAVSRRREKLPLAEWFRVPAWVRRERSGARSAQRSWLIVEAGSALARRVAVRLTTSGERVRTIDLAQLASSLLDPWREALSIDRVDALVFVADGADPDAAAAASARAPDEIDLDDSVRAGLALVRALADRPPRDPLELILVTRGAEDVLGTEPLSTQAAQIEALWRVASQECAGVTYRRIDLAAVNAGRAADASPTDEHERLCAELLRAATDATVAFRGAHRWVQTFEPCALDEEATLPIDPHGAYLITGGLGRIGVALATHLVDRGATRLALVGRTAQSRTMAALEARGAQVAIFRADVADYDQMHTVITHVRETLGEIRGVVHGAGLSGQAVFRSLAESDARLLADHLRPKLAGLQTLSTLLRDAPLDFCCTMSSLASTLGGLGLGTYSAANAAMDAYALQSRRRYGPRWTTIQWDNWLDPQHAGGEGRLEILDAEGVAAFDRVASASVSSASQVLISTTDFDRRLAEWVSPARRTVVERAPVVSAPLADSEADLQSDAEREFAAIWRDLIGVASIGRDDDFFRLGGDSLMAVQFLSRVRDQLGLSLTITQFFDTPTIAQLVAAACVDEELSALLEVASHSKDS